MKLIFIALPRNILVKVLLKIKKEKKKTYAFYILQEMPRYDLLMQWYLTGDTIVLFAIVYGI